MKIVLSFLIGVAVGVAAHWFFIQPTSNRRVTDIKESMQNSAAKVEQSFEETFDRDKMKAEMSRTGQIIREKTRKAGDAIADATANARTTARIKTKLVEDAGLSAFKIDVDTNDGVVTLSGTVSSHDEIAKAMSLALETDGVRKVISTLQVK